MTGLSPFVPLLLPHVSLRLAPASHFADFPRFPSQGYRPSNRSYFRAFPCPPQPAIVPSFRAQRGISCHPLCPVRTTLSRFIQANYQHNRFFARPCGLSLNDRACAPCSAPAPARFLALCTRQPLRRFPALPFPGLSPLLTALALAHFLVPRSPPLSRHSERSEESHGTHFALSAPHYPGSFRPTANATDSSLGLTASL